jgi:hypothetical protein
MTRNTALVLSKEEPVVMHTLGLLRYWSRMASKLHPLQEHPWVRLWEESMQRARSGYLKNG